MSDAQLPPDTVEGESDPSLQPRAHPDEAGMTAPVGLDALHVLPADDPGPDARTGENDPASDAVVPSANVHKLASEEAFDDLQPMLDLRLPDSPSLVASSPPEEALSVASELLDPPQAAPSRQEQQPHADADGAAAAADSPAEIIPVDISPIFSALDAAERDAARQRAAALDPETFDTGSILLPRSQWVEIEEEPAAPAASLQAAQSPAGEPPEFDATPDADYTIEAAASSEAPQEPAPPPGTDEQAPPSEMLQDAAARIAAEATATAAALENLKRLLVHNRAEPDIAALHNLLEPSPERSEPPPIPVYRPPARLPITPPPMLEPPQATASLAPFPEDDLPPRRPVAAVGSFFAGFALSWVLGAVLYVFLTAG